MTVTVEYDRDGVTIQARLVDANGFCLASLVAFYIGQTNNCTVNSLDPEAEAIAAIVNAAPTLVEEAERLRGEVARIPDMLAAIGYEIEKRDAARAEVAAWQAATYSATPADLADDLVAKIVERVALRGEVATLKAALAASQAGEAKLTAEAALARPSGDLRGMVDLLVKATDAYHADDGHDHDAASEVCGTAHIALLAGIASLEARATAAEQRATAAEATLASCNRARQAAEDEADRLRHGRPIEGDHVCPEALRADRMAGALREALVRARRICPLRCEAMLDDIEAALASDAPGPLTVGAALASNRRDFTNGWVACANYRGVDIDHEALEREFNATDGDPGARGGL